MKFLIEEACSYGINPLPGQAEEIVDKEEPYHKNFIIDINSVDDILSLIDKFGCGVIIEKINNPDKLTGINRKITIYNDYIE